MSSLRGQGVTPAYADELATIHLGDCLDVLRHLPDSSVDALVTDPPAGIEFMGKEWDTFRGDARQPGDPTFHSGKDASTAFGRVRHGTTAGYGRLEKYARPPGEPGERPAAGAEFDERMRANPGFAAQRLPRRCRKCGRQAWSGTPCECPEPDWELDVSARRVFVAFMTQVMTECLRVLKPGGHALVWAIPRTSHWTATAVEDAGFEVRDVITHHFGSGFPKSLDVSKAIDRQAGAVRQPLAPNPNWRGNKGAHAAAIMRPMAAGEAEVVSAPATEDAARWEGWGTALKPASEHWILARKPLSEQNVARNVLRWGTGALNIDGTRIPVVGETVTAGLSDPANRVGAVAAEAFVSQTDKDAMHAAQLASLERANRLGRWPANVALSHSEGCRQVGTKSVESDGRYLGGKGSDGAVLTTGLRRGATRKVRGASSVSSPRDYAASSYKVGEQPLHAAYAGPDGLEEVEAWDCVEGCPVAELDRQSGQRAAGSPVQGDEPSRPATNVYGDYAERAAFAGYADLGGASRFFYTAKASTSERNAGLEGLPKQFKATMNDGIGGREHNPDEPGAWQRNHHPTVKSVDLMRWLCRMVTPPGGLVLDCFMGSGSTGVAAKLEGFRFLGVEREADYVEVAKRRLTHAVHEPSLPFD